MATDPPLSKPLRMTRTSRYFFDKSPRHGSDGYTVRAKIPTRPGHLQTQRLGYVMSPKIDYDLGVLSRDIERNEPRAVFFCDTSLFDKKTPPALLEALLNERGKLVLTPLVRAELEPWMQENPEHPLTRAIRANHPGISLLGARLERNWEALAAEYYLHLLGARKYLVSWERSNFERRHGRPPDEDEQKELLRNLQRPLGPRGYLLAGKAAEAALKPTFLTDEQVVYEAVSTAILSGRPTVILTKDADLQEQFFKLTFLLTMHYRSMLLGTRYAAYFPEFTTHLMPARHRQLAQLFTGERNVLIERSERLLDEILPRPYTPVSIDCLVIEKGTTRTKFLAEREIAALLQVKGETSGLNVHSIGGRNCHVWLAPVNLPQPLSGCGAIAEDQRATMGNVQIPLLDVWQAINPIEHFREIVLV